MISESVCRSTIIGNVTLEGKDVSRITTEVMQDGVIIEKRSAQRLVDETTFKVGQRINIKLGYNGRAEKYVRRIHYRIQFGQHAGNPV